MKKRDAHVNFLNIALFADVAFAVLFIEVEVVTAADYTPRLFIYG
jgi:hypothetical protein